ncbi:MAG: transcriptional regulator, AraC family [Paenibacillaceae bacterium]|nr:transcriptional regulator, AraC family [Paenibacillaceae bacterium]
MEAVRYAGEDYFLPDAPFYINKMNEAVKDKAKDHSHDFVEICYVHAGKGYHRVDGVEYRVYKGDLFIIHYDMSHSFYRETADDDLIIYNIVFKPAFFDQVLSGIQDLDFGLLSASFLFGDLMSGATGTHRLQLSPEEQMSIDALAENMHREFSQKLNGHMSIIRAYMIELVIKIVRCLSAKEASYRNSMPADKNPIVSEIMRYLEENYSESISLSRLSLQSFFSKGYLCKVFKEATGRTISEYQQNKRISEACRLISSTGMSMTEIGLHCGFSDYKSFYKVFRKITNKSPSEYRKDSLQGDQDLNGRSPEKAGSAQTKRAESPDK